MLAFQFKAILITNMQIIVRMRVQLTMNPGSDTVVFENLHKIVRAFSVSEIETNFQISRAARAVEIVNLRELLRDYYFFLYD